MAVSPELLVPGHAGEIFIVMAQGSRLASQGTNNDLVTKTTTPRSVS